jgi:WD40-like Beta Propeller Repeat
LRTGPPLLPEAQLEGSPVWSADGKRLIFTTTGGIGSLVEQVIDRASSPKPLLKTNEHLIPTSVSSDGRFLPYAVATTGITRLDIWVLSLTDPECPTWILTASTEDRGGARCVSMTFVLAVLRCSPPPCPHRGPRQWIRSPRCATNNKGGRWIEQEPALTVRAARPRDRPTRRATPAAKWPRAQ